MPHPLFFVEKPGSKTRVAQLARNARSVVGDANRRRRLGRRRGRDMHVPAAPGERVDRVLRQHFDRPLEQHARRPCTACRFGAISESISDRVGERRHARPEVARRSRSTTPATSIGSNFGSRPMRSNRCATRSSRSRSARMCATAAVPSDRSRAPRAARSNRRGSTAACRADAPTRAPCPPTPARAPRRRACGRCKTAGEQQQQRHSPPAAPE